MTDKGMSFPHWLTLLFIGLKLTGQISWPWIWVVSPVWIIFITGLAITALTYSLTKLSK